MATLYIRRKVLKNVVLDRGVAIIGFPGMGLVGKTAVDYLITKLNASKFMVMYHCGFPAQLMVEKNGVADIIHIDFYHAKVRDKDIVLVTGNAQPLTDLHQHELSDAIVRELSERGIVELVATAAFVMDLENPSARRRVFIAGNNAEIVEKYVSYGAVKLGEGVITGMNGIVVGWASLYDIAAISALGETWRVIVELELVDYRAAAALVEFLSHVHDIPVSVDELIAKGSSIEREAASLYRRYVERAGVERKEGRTGRETTYIT